MLGAVGAYDWSGTVVQQASHGRLIFPKEAFEEILQDRNHSSYLGEARQHGPPHPDPPFPSGSPCGVSGSVRQGP